MDLLLLGANPPRAAWLLGPEITPPPPPLAKLLFQSGCPGSVGKKRIEVVSLPHSLQDSRPTLS